VLPKGVARVKLNSRFFFPFDEQYNNDGDTEDVATDLNTTLDSSIFPDVLGPLEDLFNTIAPGSLPDGVASLGESVVSFEYKAIEFRFRFDFGITDRLTAGIEIPYRWIEADVDQARVDTSNATVGFNPAFNPGMPPGPGNLPLLPVSLGGEKNDAQATELAQQELENLGFERIEDWRDDGIMDMKIGLRYQYLRRKNWRLAFTGGVRLPSGQVDDPDNLIDIGFGEGAFALFFHSNNDYRGIKNLVLNATFKYELFLPDEQTLRVVDDPDRPVTANKEEVDRNLGDVLEIEGSAVYEFLPGTAVSLLYKYARKFGDSISGDMGFNYSALEAESDGWEHIIVAGLSYSTIPLYQQKKFPIPLTAGLSYRNRFAGKNRFKTQYIGLTLAFFF
jgi:hypothetical protein